MTLSNARVIGGQMRWGTLTSQLDEKTYDVLKANAWLLLLKDKKVPTKWLKPAKNGTRVNFNCPRIQEEWDDSYADLKRFIEKVNAKHGVELYIDKDAEESA